MMGGAWAHLSGALLEKLKRFACGTAMRSERQFTHGLGDLGHMREVTWADLVDVPLQLMLDSSRRALRRKTNVAGWPHARH